MRWGFSARKRGVSEAVAMIIAFAILSLVILYAFTVLQYGLEMGREVEEPKILGESLMLSSLISGGENYTLIVNNVGSTQSEIKHLVVLTTMGKLILDLEKNNTLCTFNSRIVSPGEVIRFTCRSGYIPVGVITETGRVYSINPKYYALLVETAMGLPSIPLYAGTIVTSTSDLISLLESPGLLTSNGANSSIALSKYREYTQVNISGLFNVALVVIGKNPVSNRVNTMLIGWGFGTNSEISVTTGNNTTEKILLSSVAPYRYRVKIEGLSGNITLNNTEFNTGTSPLGIYACYINTSKTCTIKLSGLADRVVIYTSSGYEGSSGLDPYIFVGDLDGNGNVETLLITQDFTYGNSSTINDRSPPGLPWSFYVVDSTRPMRMVFRNVPIDSRNYSVAVLSLRLFYWDNSLDDINEANNLILVKAGLYDPATGRLEYEVSIGYYELCRYRQVSPFSASYIVKDFLIPIPNTNKTYYVALEIMDPYYYEASSGEFINDIDIIIGIEYASIFLSSR